MIKLVNNNPIDVLFIQPSTLFQERRIDLTVQKYYKSLEKVGELTGDNPLEPNYGLLSIATSLKEAGISIEIVDFNYIDWQLRQDGKIINDAIISEILSVKRPKVIAISFMTVSYNIWESRLRRIIRSINHMASIPLVYGGTHPSLMKKDIILPDKNLYIYAGEGEHCFKELCAMYLSADHTKKKKFSSKKIINSDILSPENLFALPLPNYNLWPTRQVERRFYTTRGCNGVCAFCSARKLVLDSKSNYLRTVYPPNINKFDKLIEAMYIEKKAGNKIIIGDLTYYSDQTYSTEFSKALINKRKREDLSLDFWCQSRSDCITDESAKMIIESGGSTVAVGGETTRDATQKQLYKGFTFSRTLKALESLRRFKLKKQLYMIIGGGGENRKDVEQNIQMIVELIEKNLVDVMHLSVLVPYPGTKLFEEPNQFGIRIVDNDLKHYWMNCDTYGYGMPVYETISPSGKTLLTNFEIYDLWLSALSKVTDAYNQKALPKEDFNHENVHTFAGTN